ncbi:MAG: hypothetical protein KGQ28_00045 [Hyphomicrobiales bacterium]|nr:hypothetical protein [Hyphomicrobiales bacterium]
MSTGARFLPATQASMMSDHFLHHVAALHFIFGLAVNAARGTPVLMRKTLLDPVAVEAR